MYPHYLLPMTYQQTIYFGILHSVGIYCPDLIKCHITASSAAESIRIKLNPISHYIRLNITPWIRFFISPKSKLKAFLMPKAWLIIYSIRRNDLTITYYTTRTIFFRQTIVSGITSLSVINIIVINILKFIERKS